MNAYRTGDPTPPGCPSMNDIAHQFGAGPFGDDQPSTDEPHATITGGIAPTTHADPPVTLEHVTAVLQGRAPGHVLWSDMDSEAFAALPDCEHCQGTGKNLAGSPWEDTPGGDKP